MNIKNNQRTRLTKILFRDAYIRLMHKKSINKITVKEICETAELNRSTFYLHYDEPKDILIEIEDDLIEKTRSSILKISALHHGDPTALIISFLEFVRNNDEIFRLMLLENANPYFKEKFIRFALDNIITGMSIDIQLPNEDYIFSFLIHGSLSLLVRWIAEDYALPVQEVASMQFKLCEGALRSISE